MKNKNGLLLVCCAALISTALWWSHHSNRAVISNTISQKATADASPALHGVPQVAEVNSRTKSTPKELIALNSPEENLDLKAVELFAVCSFDFSSGVDSNIVEALHIRDSEKIALDQVLASLIPLIQEDEIERSEQTGTVNVLMPNPDFYRKLLVEKQDSFKSILGDLRSEILLNALGKSLAFKPWETPLKIFISEVRGSSDFQEQVNIGAREVLDLNNLDLESSWNYTESFHPDVEGFVCRFGHLFDSEVWKKHLRDHPLKQEENQIGLQN